MTALAHGASTVALADERLCAAHLRQGSKSFYMAGLLMPARQKQDATALYAFCRIADDLIDDSQDPRQAHGVLHERLNQLVAASAISAAAIDALPFGEDRALARMMARHGLPRAPIDALLEGFLWDAEGRQYHTLEDTLAYGARVAGSVGVCMAWLMGQRDLTVLARAADLGVAMQLTNICRDVGEDARMGRVYLPERALGAQGIAPETLQVAAQRDARAPGDGQVLRATREVVSELLVEADRLYARGRSGIAALPWACRWAIDAAACIYRAIGDEVLRQRPYSLRKRAVVPLWRKLYLMGRCLVLPGERRGTPEHRQATALKATQFLLEPLR